MPPDFGLRSDDYAAYRPGFPPSFYERIDRIHPIAGSRALDLATGPGTVALELATRGAHVTGLDVAEGQIETARRVAAERSLDARFEVGTAEATGLGSVSFDLVTVGHAWHWFDAAKALAEIRRVLRPGGTLVIAHYSYLAEHSAVVRDTEALVLEFNSGWRMAGQSGMFPEIVDQVKHGGMALVEQFCYDHDERFTHERWRGRMRTCNGVGSGGLAPGEVERFDGELAALLRERHPDSVVIPHRVWCVVGREPD